LLTKAGAAIAAHKLAGEKCLDAIKRAFPVGTLVEVTNSSGHRHTIEVRRYGSSWYDPHRVDGINIATGKDRHFSVGFHDLRIISRPQAEQEAVS